MDSGEKRKETKLAQTQEYTTQHLKSTHTVTTAMI